MRLKLSDRPATLDDKRWQEQADQLARQGLSQVRATASAWTATIGGLTALFGLGLVVKGRSDLAGLQFGTQVAIGIFSLLAVLLAIAAIYLGALAAQGTPASIWDSGPKLKDWTLKQAAIATKLLRWSRVLMAASLVFLILSIAVDWYGPATT